MKGRVSDLSAMHKGVLLSMTVYCIWVVATYFMEGRILTLLRPEAAVDRLAYTIVANMLIGILAAGVVLRTSLISGIAPPEQLGFRSIRRTLLAVGIAGAFGSLFIALRGLPSPDPIVILNAYAQVLTVSVAEIMVCWAVIGVTFENLAGSRGRIASIITGIIAANVLFGIYHFGHSPPFNQVNMVLFLTLIATMTSLLYFLGRDIYAAIVFHNFLGTAGVMESLEASGNLGAYSQPLYHLLVLAVLSLVILAGVDILYIRKGQVR